MDRARTLYRTVLLVCGLLLVPTAAADAAYNVTISDAPTSNFSLMTFSASGDDAVLNAGDLANALQFRGVTVTTGAGGSQAGRIVVAAPVSTSGFGNLNLSPAAGAGVTLAAPKIETGGKQTYLGPVAAATEVGVSAPDGITFSSTVDGPGALTVAGDTRFVVFSGTVGGTAPPASLRSGDLGATRVGASITTAGELTLNNPLFLDASATLTSLAGRVKIGNGGRLGANTLTLVGDADVPGGLEGTGGVTKAGTGTLTLGFNPNTYTGATTLVAGGLHLNDDNGPGPVYVTGGTLSGSGRVGPLDVSAATVDISPGGTLRTGNLTMGDSSVLRVQPTSLVSSRPDLEVTGTVALSGARFVIPSQRAGRLEGSAWTVIANDGTDPVNGTFVGLPSGTLVADGRVRYRIDYAGGDGNDVVLTRVRLTTTTVVTATPQSSTRGTTVTYRALITGPSEEPFKPTGTVLFSELGKQVAALFMRDGVATRGLRLAIGDHPIVAIYSGDETYAPSTSAPFTARVTERPPALSVSNATGKEGDRARRGRKPPKPRFVVFTVVLSKPFAVPVTVTYATKNVTAKAGKDYVAKKGKLTFKPGTRRLQVAVAIVADGARERSKQFSLRLRSATNATLQRSEGTGKIVDDD